MEHLTASTSAIPFSGEDWFDPLEDAIRFRVRAFIEAVVEEEAHVALGGRERYQRNGPPKGYRNGHRHRQLVGTFGALTVSLPRVRLLDGDGGEKEWRSQTIQAYKRLTKRAEAIIATTYLAGTNTRRVRRALAGLFGGKVGKDAVSRAWRKVKTDWESWQARDLSGEDIVRLILDGTGVKARLDGRVMSIPLLVVLGVRRDGQKVLLAVKNMGGETEAAWRHVLEDLLGRGLKAPELLIVDGGKGLEAALAIGRNMQRHRHQEFIRFLNQIERDVPAGKVIHVILDNYCTHKHAKVRAWLERHPRWTFHFIPTSSSWLNAVEGFFAKLTRRRLKHGVFHSVVDLQAAINRFIAEHNNTEAKPFMWRADPDDIIAARNRGFQMLDSIH